MQISVETILSEAHDSLPFQARGLPRKILNLTARKYGYIIQGNSKNPQKYIEALSAVYASTEIYSNTISKSMNEIRDNIDRFLESLSEEDQLLFSNYLLKITQKK